MKTSNYLNSAIVAISVGLIFFSSCKKESSEKQIISFVFEDLNPPVAGTISQNTIEATVPNSTDVTNLKPNITISDKASINPSSGSPQDFTSSVQYIVTAEDGSIAGYTVKVKIEGDKDFYTINWTKIAESPTKRGWMPAVTLNDKMYLIGGIIETSLSSTPSMEVYDPATDSWDTTKGKMVYRRYAHSANVINGKIYVMGGIQDFIGPAMNSIEAYDPQTDQWEVVEVMPQARAAHATCVLNGKIYVIGGETAEPTKADNLLDDVEVFDPASYSWETKAPLPVPMAYLSASVVNGKIYVFGGTASPPWEGEPTVYEYDPHADVWVNKTNTKYARLALSTCSINDFVFIIGGAGSGLSSGLAIVEVYSPSADKSFSGTGMLTKCYAQGVCIYQDKIYVFSGCNTPYPYLGYTNLAEVGVPEW